MAIRKKTRNKLTSEDISNMERIMNKCSDIQINLWMERLNKELYNRLSKRRE